MMSIVWRMHYAMKSSFADHYTNNDNSVNEIILPASCIELIN